MIQLAFLACVLLGARWSRERTAALRIDVRRRTTEAIVYRGRFDAPLRLVRSGPELIITSAEKAYIDVPARVRPAQLSHGQFRNALLLDEQHRRPTPVLAAFIQRFHLEAYTPPTILEQEALKARSTR